MAVNNNLGFGSGVMVGGNPLNTQNKRSSVYNTAPNKVEKFPGLNSQQIANIEKYTENLTGMEKTMEQQKLYQAMIEQIQTDNYKENRTAAENEMLYKSFGLPSVQQIKNAASNVRQEILADMTKEKFGLRADADTEGVISGLIKYANDQGVSLDSLNKYLDSGDETFLYEVGLKTQPIKEDARSIRGTIANQEEKEWNDNFFGRLETEEYDEDDDLLGNIWTFTKNAAKSGVNVLSDVGNMVLNPLDTTNALGKTAVGGVANLLGVDEDMAEWGDWWASANDTADQVGQFFSDRYGGGDEILNTFFTDPVGMFSDAATLVSGGAGIVKGAATAGAKATAKAGLKGVSSTLDDVSKTAGKVSKTANAIDPYTVAMKLEMKPISKTVDAVKKLPGAAKKMKENLNNAVDSAYGLDELTKKNIQDNPFSKEVWQKGKAYIEANGLPEKSTEVSKALITDVADRVQETMKNQMKEYSETRPYYKTLKDAGYSVDLSELKAGINEMLEEYGIEIKDGKLDFSKTAIDGSEASNIIKMYNWVNSIDAPMSMTEYLDRFRRTLSDMVDYNPANKDNIGRKVKDTPGDKVIKGIREKANQLAHDQVPALKDLDTLFKKQTELIDEVTEGIVYKDSKKKGVVRDNINQIMKNLDEPNRRVLKNRLEKILPGIEEEVKAINMLPKLIDHYYKPSKMQEKISAFGGGAFGSVVGGTPGMLIGAGLGYGISKLINKLKSKRWDEVISNMGEGGAEKMAEIEKQIANNQKISQEQKAFLNQISEKLKEGKKVKEGEITRIIADMVSAEDELAAVEKGISELESIGAKEELKEWKSIRDDMLKQAEEDAQMEKAKTEFEAEKENIVNESADQRLPEFKKRIYQLQQQEKRIGAVANKKLGKTFEGNDFKKKQNTEWLRKKEAIIKDIMEYYNVDQFEASNIFDRIEKQAGPDDLK